MAPYVDDATLGALAKSISVAYPIGDVLLVAAVLRLVFDGGRRPSSFYLLVAATATLFAADAAYGYALLKGTFHHQLIYDVGWIGFYLLWGATALDPTMPLLTEATPDRERRLTSRRLALLSVAALMAPTIEIIREARAGNVDLTVVVGASMVLFLLVIVRVVGLAHQHERAVSRERVLGDAAVALVTAVTEGDVRAVALDAAEALIGDAGAVRACSGAPAGLTLIGAGDAPLSGDTAAQLGAAIGMPEGGPIDLGARDELGVSRVATRITVFSVIHALA